MFIIYYHSSRNIIITCILLMPWYQSHARVIILTMHVLSIQSHALVLAHRQAVTAVTKQAGASFIHLPRHGIGHTPCSDYCMSYLHAPHDLHTAWCMGAWAHGCMHEVAPQNVRSEWGRASMLHAACYRNMNRHSHMTHGYLRTLLCVLLLVCSMYVRIPCMFII